MRFEKFYYLVCGIFLSGTAITGTSAQPPPLPEPLPCLVDSQAPAAHTECLAPQLQLKHPLLQERFILNELENRLNEQSAAREKLRKKITTLQKKIKTARETHVFSIKLNKKKLSLELHVNPWRIFVNLKKLNRQLTALEMQEKTIAGEMRRLSDRIKELHTLRLPERTPLEATTTPEPDLSVAPVAHQSRTPRKKTPAVPRNQIDEHALIPLLAPENLPQLLTEKTNTPAEKFRIFAAGRLHRTLEDISLVPAMEQYLSLVLQSEEQLRAPEVEGRGDDNGQMRTYQLFVHRAVKIPSGYTLDTFLSHIISRLQSMLDKPKSAQIAEHRMKGKHTPELKNIYELRDGRNNRIFALIDEENAKIIVVAYLSHGKLGEDRKYDRTLLPYARQPLEKLIAAHNPLYYIPTVIWTIRPDAENTYHRLFFSTNEFAPEKTPGRPSIVPINCAL